MVDEYSLAKLSSQKRAGKAGLYELYNPADDVQE